MNQAVPKKWEEYVGQCSNETHIEKKGEDLELETFEYKGCWNCRWFTLNEKHYMSIEQAAKEYGKSKSTIRQWCREGTIEAKLCKKERYGFGSTQKWIIKKQKEEVI